ncbi:hypothetical protein GCM10017673_56460 [Streptosporangium violaceochromogenes]|nr:hypothetical protein GCM10017673_56460 [Streptosporangium violaceochromogenes]
MVTVAAAKPHADAVLLLLAAVNVLAGRGEVPAGGGWQGEPGDSPFVGYVVLFPFTGSDDPLSLAQVYDDFDFPFQITAVGVVSDQAEQVMDAVRAGLVGATPAVAGRRAYPIYPVPLNRPITRDDAADPPVFYGVAQFHFRSHPI